jgi:sodium bicarbonate transporter 10
MAINFSPGQPLDYTCFCEAESLPSGRVLIQDESQFNRTAIAWCRKTVVGGALVGPGCDTPPYVPNVFLLSVILFATTYVISLSLKDMKTSTFFPTKVRSFLSDFAVVIAIFSMTAIDAWIGLPTPKLLVPHDFKVS